MEALIRWRHPERGMILPAGFIPAAEQSSLMPELTAFVVDAALAQAALWRLLRLAGVDTLIDGFGQLMQEF